MKEFAIELGGNHSDELADGLLGAQLWFEPPIKPDMKEVVHDEQKQQDDYNGIGIVVVHVVGVHWFPSSLKTRFRSPNAHVRA